jgi:hypothetical protein
MRNWLEASGVHIGTATRHGIPTVIVVGKAHIENDDTVRLRLSASQLEQIKTNILENPQVALGPGGLGSIRAAYQFKGKARLDGQDLVVQIEEIYCTKPGPEAGLRIDTLPFDSLRRFEESRWRDSGPPR